MPNKKLDSYNYNITANLKLNVGLTIEATSLEDAISKARQLKETDFVNIKDAYNDGEVELIGVYKIEKWS